MPGSTLYSIEEARELLGGIARDTLYKLLRTGQLASTVVGRRRFISQSALDAYVAAHTTTTVAPAAAPLRPPT
ncbi:MAG TPA: helix-turn-helix domain-containing protein [Steroidobacteraceae bacterium]|jgi:excisionase family DNA binding protein